jgi:hypothetical protein
MALFWIGVGTFNPISLSRVTRFNGTFISLKPFTGTGETETTNPISLRRVTRCDVTLISLKPFTDETEATFLPAFRICGATMAAIKFPHSRNMMISGFEKDYSRKSRRVTAYELASKQLCERRTTSKK